MRIIFAPVLSFLIIFFSGSAAGLSQGISSGTSDELKIGIALSGGGAKGFSHIGVLKVLEEENIPIHVVTGSSMGAVIGGLYSIGYTPEQLSRIALDTDWQTLFNDHYKPSSRDLTTFVSTRDTWLLSFPVVNRRPQLPAGLVDGQNLSMLLYRLMLPYQGTDDFKTLPTSFAAVATDLQTGRAHRFESGYLPDVVRASAAIPSIFKPVPIGEQLYIDGGVARSIPVEDARAIGADIVLVSDVGEPVKRVDSLITFVDILFQAIGFHQAESDTRQIRLADLYIRPDIKNYNSFSYDKVTELIEKGEEEARKSLPALRALLDSVEVASKGDRPEIRVDDNRTYLISGIEFQNIEGRLLRQAEAVLNIDPPKSLSYNDIERRVNRLYGIESFGHISYRLTADPESPGSQMLSLRFSYSEPDRVGFSMRYDSRYKASLLFGAGLWNELTPGDRLASELRLGEILGVTAQYDLPLTLKPPSTFHFNTRFYRSPVDLYVDDDRLSTVEVKLFELKPSVTIRPFEHWSIGLGVIAGFYNFDESVGAFLPLLENRFLLNGLALLEYDNLNRNYFFTHGQRFRFRAEASERNLLSDRSFLQLFAEWQAAVPLLNDVQLLARVSAGHSTGDDLPLHYLFYLGGFSGNPVFDIRQSPLLGYSSQQLSGTNMRSAAASLQFHLGDEIFLRTTWNAAHLSESESWNPANLELRHGFGISGGALTLVGPVEFSVSTPDFTDTYLFELDIGYRF